MNDETLLSIGLFVFVAGFVLLVIKYLRDFKTLHKAYQDAKIEWPMSAKRTLSDNYSPDNIKKTLSGPFKLLMLIIFNYPNNPLLRKAVKSIRFTLVMFALFPFVLFFAIIILLSVIK